MYQRRRESQMTNDVRELPLKSTGQDDGFSVIALLYVPRMNDCAIQTDDGNNSDRWFFSGLGTDQRADNDYSTRLRPVSFLGE